MAYNNEEEKKENKAEETHLENESKEVKDNLEERLKEMQDLISKKDSEIFDLKMENIKLKEKLRQESEIYERELKRKLLKERIDIFKEFLEVLDNIERAFDSMQSESENLKGLLLIKEQLLKFLSSYGVKEMDLANKVYDPNIADIGEVVETNDYPPNTIIRVLRKGYYIGDDVLRTAIVSVAVPKKDTQDIQDNSTN